MSCLKVCFVFLFLFLNFLPAEEITSEHAPLYSGTILAFYPQNADPGRLSVSPYLTASKRYGFYNKNWSCPKQKHSDQISFLLSLETGITDYLDITLDLDGAYSNFNHKHSWIYGDTSLFLGFQALHDKRNTATPDLRLLLGETFPTGKYDRLNPNKNGSDIFGSGAYATTLLLVLAKTVYWLPKHPFNFNLNLYYIISSHASIHGFNAYGGSSNTHGKAKPGDQFITNLAIQYSLDRRWALGTDIHYIHQNKSHFSGKKGTLPNGSIPSTTLPSSEQFSLSPCLEYIWSEDCSITLGPWFTVAGRNSLKFMSAAGTVFYYF